MTIEETFPLHRCIFRNDLEALNNILKDEESKKQINKRDNHGNTPIHLALMLDRRNCILSLIKNGCDCVTRNNFGWNPLEEAIMLGDMDLVEKLSYMKFKSYFDGFGKEGGIIDQWNDKLPNCHMKLQMKFKSKIPLLEKLGIKDIEHFYKKGKNFRMDFGFSGFDFRGVPRMMKGSLSVILTFGYNDTTRCYLLDHKAKRYTELFPKTSPKISDAYSQTKMDVKTMFKFYADNSKLRVKKKSNTSNFGFKNKKRTIRINGNQKYNTDLFKFKDAILIIRKRDNEQIIGDYKSHIKTTVTDLDKFKNNTNTISSEINNTLFSVNDEKLKGFTMKDMVKLEKEISNADSDSDSNDSDIENDISESSSDVNTKIIEADTDFKKFIDENIYNISAVDSTVSDHVIQMVLKGSDDNGNKITDEDILYVDQILPSFYSAYLKEKRLPEDQQKKLENIYHTVVVKIELGDMKISNNEYIENFKKSENVSNMVHNLAENYYNKTEKKSSSEHKSFKNVPIKREPITEEEYFNPANTESLHLGRVMEISEEKKFIKTVIKFWLTKENAFPLNCYHIKPIIDIICLIIFDQVNVTPEENNYDRHLYYNTCNFILREVNATKRFPLKFEIPIMASTAFQSKLLELDTEPVSDDLFKIPEDYVYDDNVAFRFIK